MDISKANVQIQCVMNTHEYINEVKSKRDTQTFG